jgi:transposase-like protein
MEAAVKIAKQRLSVLDLAEQLGSVSMACRCRGMDRTSFYEWKRRFQTHGLEGLKDLPPIHKSHPQTVKGENDIEHRRTQVRHPQTNGFVERFNRTVLDEFFRIVFRQKLYESVESLQVDLDKWLQEYNYERPHLGYRTQGRRPWEMIEMFLAGTLKM